MAELKTLQDFLDISEDENIIYRYLVFKKVFTPYEIDGKFQDESIYEDSHYNFGIIEDAVLMPDNEILLGFRDVDEYDLNPTGRVSYHKLSDIVIERFDYDNGEREEDNEVLDSETTPDSEQSW